MVPLVGRRSLPDLEVLPEVVTVRELVDHDHVLDPLSVQEPAVTESPSPAPTPPSTYGDRYHPTPTFPPSHRSFTALLRVDRGPVVVGPPVTARRQRESRNVTIDFYRGIVQPSPVGRRRRELSTPCSVPGPTCGRPGSSRTTSRTGFAALSVESQGRRPRLGRDRVHPPTVAKGSVPTSVRIRPLSSHRPPYDSPLPVSFPCLPPLSVWGW